MKLTIGDETFRVESEGADERPAVLLSCSLGSDISLFEAQMPALREHFRIVRYDPRGHGGSSVAAAPYSLEQLGRDALAILDALSIETAHFIGVSMGGAVGQWLLVNAPERIGRAVLANTAARIGPPDVWNARIAAARAEGPQALAPVTMERWFSPAFHASAAERVAAVDAVFRQTPAEGYAGACAALRDMDLREAIRRIEHPVLVVTGRDDPVIGAADVALLTGAIRGARHVELDGRHISNIECDEAFNAAVVAFLRAPAHEVRRQPARTPPAPRRPATGRATTARNPLKPAAARRGAARRTATVAPATAKTTGKGKAGSSCAPGASPKAPAPRKTPEPARDATRNAMPGSAAKGTKTAAGEAPAAKKAAARKPAAKKAVVKKAVARTVIAKKPAAKKPAAKKAMAKTPMAKTPTAKTPRAKTPRAKTPRAKTPTAKKTLAKTAVGKTVAKKPLAKKVVAKTSIARKTTKKAVGRPPVSRRVAPKRSGRRRR